MQILGDLASLGAIPGVGWVLRCIIRDILDHKHKRETLALKRQLLQRIPDDQVASVLSELGVEQRQVAE